MILVFPIAIALAVMAIARSHDSLSGRGWLWFFSWGAAGAGMSFSFVTGFSIGLLVLPAALVLLYVVVRRSPQWVESVGFLEGIGWTLLLVAGLNADPGGLDARPWLFAGTAFVALSAVTYSLASARRPVSDTRTKL